MQHLLRIAGYDPAKRSVFSLVLSAVYKSKEAYDRHMEQDYLKAFFRFLEGKLTEKPEIDFLEEI
ncbi:MAG: hypothetical protein ABI113_22350 [Mucilaginibacter sp.]